MVNESKKKCLSYIESKLAIMQAPAVIQRKLTIISLPLNVSFVSVSLLVSACMSSALLLCQQFNYVVDVLLARSSPLLQLAEH